MTKKILTASAKYILVFALTAALMFFLLVASALIPRSAIKNNIYSSSIYFCEHELFPYHIDSIKATVIDNYADTITASIAWGFNEADPFVSVMRASYYDDGFRNVNDCLREGLETDTEPYKEYIRYWHGSAGVFRFMHLFTDINGMRIIAAVLIYGLAAALAVILVIKKFYTEAVCAVLALASVSLWFVADSMQNVWCVIIMLAVSIVCVLLAFKGKYESICTVLLVSGVVTNFFDFLTTETMTVLFPLMLVFSIKRREGGKLKEDIIYAVKCCALWLGGYGVMWALKWLSAALILQTDVLPFITEHIAERLDERGETALLPYLWETLTRNIGNLFPLAYNEIGIICCIITVLGLCFYGFVYRRKGADKGLILLLLLLGVIVYVRYLILHNHSYGHHFFTYRAQISPVLAVLISLTELTGHRAGRTETKAREIKAPSKRKGKKHGQKT